MLVSLLFILLISLFFYKTIFLGFVPISSDIPIYFYPQRFFITEALKNGLIPLWNPYIFCGTPLLSNPQAQFFYPFSFLFYLFGTDLGLALFIAIHFFIACIFSYLLSKTLGLSKESSIIAAISYTFSGWLISSTDILIAITSSSLLPLVFYLYLKSLNSFIYTVFAGFAFSLQILAGEPFISYITALFLIFHSIFSNNILYRLKRLFLILLIGFGLSLFQMLPFIEFSFFSLRAEKAPDKTFWSFTLYEAIRFFLPSSLGNPNDFTYKIANALGIQLYLDSPYIGIIPLILLFLAFKERRHLFFLFGIIFSLLFAFGKYTPIYSLTKFLLGFELLRYPVKFLAIFTLCSSILAGFGFSLLLQKKGSFLFSFFSIFFFLSTIFIYIGKDILIALISGYVNTPCANYWASLIFYDTLFITTILFFATTLILLFNKGKIKKGFFFFSILFLLIIDLFSFGERLIPLTSKEIYQKESKVIEFLKNQDGLFRIFISPLTRKAFMEPQEKTHEECHLVRMKYLIPNIGMLHRISDCYGYEPLIIARHAQFIWLIDTEKPINVINLLDLINAKYIISKDPIKGVFKPIFEDEEKGLFLYENPSVLPRAFFVPKYRVIKDRWRVLEELGKASFDPRKEVILEEEPEARSQKPEDRRQKTECKIIKYELNRVKIEVEAKEGGFLFLSDAYYPSWKAFVGGRETKIYKANYCFRAIKIDKGRHIVEFRYFPKTFIIGAIGSVISIILVLYCLLLKRWKGSKTFVPF